MGYIFRIFQPSHVKIQSLDGTRCYLGPPGNKHGYKIYKQCQTAPLFKICLEKKTVKKISDYGKNIWARLVCLKSAPSAQSWAGQVYLKLFSRCSTLQDCWILFLMFFIRQTIFITCFARL